jgi:hypothetical protein
MVCQSGQCTDPALPIKNDLKAFMTFTGIVQAKEFRTVTRGHVLAWRTDLEK